jgi:hypothetical protein
VRLKLVQQIVAAFRSITAALRTPPTKLIARLKGSSPVVYSSQVHPTPKRSRLQDKGNGGTSDVPVMVRRVQPDRARWWHRLQPVRVQREHDASDTRAKRGHNAKNNARITRNNAEICGSRVAPGAAYVLYLRELLPDRKRNSENYYPVLVNSELASFSPARLGRGFKRTYLSAFISGLIGFFLSSLPARLKTRPGIGCCGKSGKLLAIFLI